MRSFLNRKWVNLQFSKATFGARNSCQYFVTFSAEYWGWWVCFKCWGTEMMLDLETSLHGSTSLGITVQSISVWPWSTRRVCAVPATPGAMPPKGTVPIAVQGRDPLARMSSPSRAAPACSCSTVTCFRHRPPGNATDVTHGCILEPDENIHFTPQTYFFSPSDAFFYRVSI